MIEARTHATVTRMGTRAGQSFVDTGIWPRCPFQGAELAEFALIWGAAMFGVVGPARSAAATPAAHGAG